MKPHIKNLSLLLVRITGVGLMLAGPVMAQTFTTLHSFTALSNNPNYGNTNSDGQFPNGDLTLSGDTLYGTAQNGGDSGRGTVFAVNTDGTGFTTLHSFYSPSIYRDGNTPLAGLVVSGTTLYGATASGGIFGSGTVFAVNTNGSGFTNLYNFTGVNDGNYPDSRLLLSGNTLYGTAGNLFAINTDGTGVTNVKSFGDGNLALLGNTLYGTAPGDGNTDQGRVFAVNTDGTGFTNLHIFTALTNSPLYGGTNSDGTHPRGGLVLYRSTLYGTAATGGNYGMGTVFAVNTDGSGFRNLHSFTANVPFLLITNSDGAFPSAGLTLSGNTLYGTASTGGGSANGTIFAVNTDGTGFTTLLSFTGYPNSSFPRGGMVLSGNTLYGTAQLGGDSGSGSVFSISFPPHLTILSSMSNLILSWPTNYAGFDYTRYVLQSTTDLVSPVWTTNSTAAVIVNGLYTVTNPISGTQQFFRLSQ